MNLTELLEAIRERGHLSASRYKDLKTSTRYLAKALGKNSPDHCDEEEFVLPEAEWKGRLNRHLDSLEPRPSPHTVRNSRNNLSCLFRQARALGVLRPLSGLPMAPIPLKEHLRQTEKRYRHRILRGGYALEREHWPADIREAWDGYCRERSLTIRQPTLTTRQEVLETYIGFLTKIEHLSITRWDELFNLVYLDRFVRWNSQRVHVRITHLAKGTAETLRHLATYLKRSEADAIAAYYRKLPTPEPMHDKKAHWFTLRELEQAALGIFEDARKPVTTSHRNARKGLIRALQHGHALMLRLLVRIPVRQRNLRELQLGRNLYQDHRGDWLLEFKGEELKIGEKNGRMNRFQINLSQYCPDLLPHLEEYLHQHRPLIPNGDRDPHVFLTPTGHAHSPEGLHQTLRNAVLRRTNKPFYPHLVRTLWATEFIARTGDFATAAYMLNDRVETVLARYHEILEQEHAQKAQSFLSQALGTDPARRHTRQPRSRSGSQEAEPGNTAEDEPPTSPDTES